MALGGGLFGGVCFLERYEFRGVVFGVEDDNAPVRAGINDRRITNVSFFGFVEMTVEDVIVVAGFGVFVGSVFDDTMRDGEGNAAKFEFGEGSV